MDEVLERRRHNALSTNYLVRQPGSSPLCNRRDRVGCSVSGVANELALRVVQQQGREVALTG